MCKNLMIVGIGRNKQKELWEFVQNMAPVMTEHDDDGLGFVASTDKGLWGERWLNPKEAFSYRKPWSQKDQEIKDNFEGVLQGDARYNAFIENKKANQLPVHTLMMHARMATCDRGLNNVHPFYREGTALIHNGVISNVKQLRQITSTCDSECILNCYVDAKVNENPEKIKEVGDALRGYYGCGVLSKDKDGTQIIDIFRGPNPYIYAVNIPALEALVFCTAPQMLIAVCKKLKWSYGAFFSLKENTMLRMNAVTGKKIGSYSFQPKEKETWASYRGHLNYSEWMERQSKEDNETQAKLDIATGKTTDPKVTTAATTTETVKEEPKQIEGPQNQEKKSLTPKEMELEFLTKLRQTSGSSDTTAANLKMTH